MSSITHECLIPQIPQYAINSPIIKTYTREICQQSIHYICSVYGKYQNGWDNICGEDIQSLYVSEISITGINNISHFGVCKKHFGMSLNWISVRMDRTNNVA